MKLKNWLALWGVLLSLVAFNVSAAADNELKTRLAKVNVLHASFTQSVYSADNQLVQEGKGELWLSRPNLFRWVMTEPDESLLVSDGKTLWFYNPFVEQVTALWLNDATNNTPFMLITRNSDAQWSKFHIAQQGDTFVLTPKSQKGEDKPFDITVTPTGKILSFVAKEADGQKSIYRLSNHTSASVSADKFIFKVPKGVTLDDQRQ